MDVTFSGLDHPEKLHVIMPFAPSGGVIASLLGAEGVYRCDVAGGRVIVVCHDGRDPINLAAQCLHAIAAYYSISVVAKLSTYVNMIYGVDAAWCQRQADLIDLAAIMQSTPRRVLIHDVEIERDALGRRYTLQAAA